MNRTNVPFSPLNRQKKTTPFQIPYFQIKFGSLPRATILDGVRDMEYVVLSLTKVKKKGLL
jgi:hypothetical protein